MHTFPPGANVIGGRSAAPVLVALADEFYAEIIPVVVELRGKGLSLRAIARELDRREIRTRVGCYHCEHGDVQIVCWNASQVRRVLLRAARQSGEQRRSAEERSQRNFAIWLNDEALYCTEQDVLAMLDSGAVTPNTLCFRKGAGVWQPIRELFGVDANR